MFVPLPCGIVGTASLAADCQSLLGHSHADDTQAVVPYSAKRLQNMERTIRPLRATHADRECLSSSLRLCLAPQRRPHGEDHLLAHGEVPQGADRPPAHAMGGALPPDAAPPAGQRLPGPRGGLLFERFLFEESGSKKWISLSKAFCSKRDLRPWQESFRENRANGNPLRRRSCCWELSSGIGACQWPTSLASTVQSVHASRCGCGTWRLGTACTRTTLGSPSRLWRSAPWMTSSPSPPGTR